MLQGDNMSEKFTIAVWNADGTPKTGASVALLGAGTYSGTELGASGRYYWASIPLGKYFLRVNGVDTGESFAVGDGEEVKKAGDTMTGSLDVESALYGYYDSANKFSPNGYFVSYALENEGSFFYQSNRFDPNKKISGTSNALKSELSVRYGFGHEIEAYVGEDKTELQILRDGNGVVIYSDDDGLGDPRTVLKINSFNKSLEIQALSDKIQLVNTDNASVDTLNLPTVTGETKTLATLSDITGEISDHIADADPHTQYRLKSESVPWGDISGEPTTLAGYGITDAINTGATAQTKAGGLTLGGDLGMGTGRINFDDAIFRQYTGNTDFFAIYPSASTTGAPSSTNFAFLVRRNGEVTALNSDVSTQISVAGVAKLTATASALTASEKIVTSASTTTRAGVNLPHGTDPTSPANGDKWTTTAGEFTRVNGVTYETAVKSFVGNLQLISLGNTAIGQNTVTGERGHLVRMVNGTGATSVKGNLISASTTVDNQFVLQANEFDAFGVVAESGIASGQECWIWVNGSTCEVLWENGQSSTRGYVAICAPTDGRALNVAVPSSNPTVGEHFKEIGHVLQSKVSGTNVMVLCQIHFN